MSKYYLESDNYETPSWVVGELIASMNIPLTTRIWCPFHGIHGQMISVLRSLNFNVVNNEDVDFFDCEEPKEWDMIIDNPPFSKMQKIVPRALSFGKPVILILPLINIRTKWLREVTKEKAQHLINAIPSTRVNYDLYGQRTKHNTKETAWYCWNCQGLFKEENKGVIFL